MQENPILRRRAFFTGEVHPGMHTKDVTWIRPDGAEMTDADWSEPDRRSIGMLMLGQAADEVDIRGRAAAGDTLLLLLNAGWRTHSYVLPRMEVPGRWEEVLNTANPESRSRLIRNEVVSLTSHSCQLLRHNERKV
jgi:glycogen operon protein